MVRITLLLILRCQTLHCRCDYILEARVGSVTLTALSVVNIRFCSVQLSLYAKHDARTSFELDRTNSPCYGRPEFEVYLRISRSARVIRGITYLCKGTQTGLLKQNKTFYLRRVERRTFKVLKGSTNVISV